MVLQQQKDDSIITLVRITLTVTLNANKGAN